MAKCACVVHLSTGCFEDNLFTEVYVYTVRHLSEYSVFLLSNSGYTLTGHVIDVLRVCLCLQTAVLCILSNLQPLASL